jgi:PAS domain S-box-containing protein
MCINVIKGEVDPKLQFYTKGGSFYINGTTRFLATVPEEERGRTRNMCNRAGYESVALIPIRLGTRVLGLIHVADHQENMVPLEMVEMLEKVGIELGTAIQRVQAEEALREERDKAQKYLDIAGVIFVVIDSNQKVSLINRRGCEILEYSEEEIVGKNWFDIFLPEEIRNEVRADFEELVAGNIEAVEYYENPVLTKSGEERIIAWHNTVLTDEASNIVGTLSSGEDITGRKRAEERLRDALKESQRRRVEISALLEGSRAVLEYHEFQNAARSIFDSCKNLIGATAGYVALLSADGIENEVLFLDSGELPCTVDPSLPMPIRGLRGEAYRTGEVVYDNDFSRSEWIKYMPEGHASLDNVLFAPLMIEGEAVGLLGLANKPGGFTENDARLASAFGELAAIALHNNRTLGLLENSEQRFRSVVQTASDAIVVTDSSGDMVFWNYGAEAIFGYSTGEALGKPVASIMPERFQEAHRRGMNRVLSTAESNIIGETIEAVGLRKDGSEFPVELSLATWKARGEAFFTAIIRDITQRKEEEARKAAEQESERQRVLSMRSDRLRSLGEMAAGIAHELNQPLVGVRGLAEHLMISIDRGWELTEEKIRDRANVIVEQADRMVHIIEHVRMFARESGKPELRPVHVNDVVRSGIDMLGTQLRSRGIQLEHEFTEPLPVVSANPFSLEEVVINLLVNARDALEEQLKAGSVSAPPRVVLRTLRDGSGSEEHVKIEVMDSGVGIPEHIIEKAFDPFFTTKGPDKGTGLGLSICRSIVEGFGGRIRIQSTPGEGTTVTISLPVG